MTPDISMPSGARNLFVALCCAAACFSQTDTADGITAYRTGHYSVAQEKLLHATAANPSDATASGFLALAEAAKQDCAKAIPSLRLAMESGPGDELTTMAGLALSQCQIQSGSTTDALDTLDKLAKRFPRNADVLYARAKLHMRAFNDATFAMFQGAPSSYRVHQLSAEVFEVENRYSDAIAEYRKAIAENPKAVDLHYRLGRALLLESHNATNLEEAQKEFAAELALCPEDAASEFQLGQISQAEGKLGDARTHFEAALRLSPTFAEAEIALGKMDTAAKSYPAAAAHLERAVKLQPSNENAHYALMMAYRDSGDIAKAKQEKATLDRLQKPPEGEFTDFLKKLGEKPPP
jgi:tetratricopeptide (TPR) repeat protein